MTDLLRWGMIFPERRSFGAGTRRIIELIQEHRLPAALGAAATVGLSAAIWCGAGYVHYQQLAVGEQAAAIRAERVNADLQDALARLQDQLGAARQSLNSAQGRLSALSDDSQRQLSASEQSSSSKADRIAQLTKALEQAQRDLHLAEAQRATLMARVSKAETDLAEGQSRQAQSQELQKKMQELTAERDKAASERDQLRARIGELQQKNSGVQGRETQKPVAEAQPQPAAPVTTAPARPDAAGVAPASAAPAPAVAVATPTAGAIAQLERVLASAGVDVPRLFARLDAHRGQGGPFIPVARGVHPETLTPEKLAALRVLLKMLPVSAPLQSFEISSPFGVRGDPENGHGSFHTGVDLRAPYMSPVYATAPGVVTYAGYRDDYGKVVEIDHGNGLATRYAHLSRYTVSVGQQVGGRAQIGFLGSTGRATGPHVHYEVLVNGEPQDPEKFLGLARLVSAVER